MEVNHLFYLVSVILSLGIAFLFSRKYNPESVPESVFDPVPTDPLDPPDLPQNAPVNENKLRLCYEAQPFVITQKWGVHSPKTYLRFGFTDHNGIDILHGYNARIRAPFDYEFYRTLWQPTGGGKVLSILSKYEYLAPDGKLARVLIDYLHLSKVLDVPEEGKLGDLICIAGNTGYTTGPHTHIQHRWVRLFNGDWEPIEKNRANDSFDPTSFYTGEYSVDNV